MNIIKNIKKETMAAAVVYICSGLFLTVFPETTAKSIGYVIACFLLIMGLRSIFNYMMRDVSVVFYHNDLVVAALFILASIGVFINVEAVVSVIPFILGIIVSISGVIKLQNAINLKRLNHGGALTVFILAAANIIFGVVLIINPFQVMTTLIRIVGIGLIFSGVTDCFTLFSIAKKIKMYEESNSVIEGKIIAETKD